MCITSELAHARKRIIELEAQVATLEAREWTPYPPVSGVERISPQGWVDFNRISMQQNKVVVNGDILRYGILADTNSMDGVMDAPHIVVGETVFDRNQLQVGDIVSYQTESSNTIIHQIIKIETDSEGRLYTLQGTNNDRPDTYQVRNENILSVLICLIYARER